MKKKIILTLVIALVLSIAGCKKDATTEDVSEKEEIVTQVEDPTIAEIKNYLDKYINTSERPMAVMVDNDNEYARPQAGLDEAYLVYEMPVEGGATRFMALFRGVETEKIGPIRSSRHYFLDFAKENDAIYTHYGWSPKASKDISSLGVNNINGMNGSDEKIFWREKKFKGDWHSAYTSIQNIKERSDKKGYIAETDIKNGIKYSDEEVYLLGENNASKILLPYSGLYKTGYTYNDETTLYEKQTNGEPHNMQNGNVLSFKNIIVEFIADKSLGDGSDRREIITTGSGRGYYFTNGACVEITWSKESRTAPTIYKRMDGSELEINAGNTMVNIISPGAGTKVE